MKLHILSDLHTEFADFTPPHTDADVVVLAGDIGVGEGGIEWAARHFADVPVIYVPGNHEFYHHDICLANQLKRKSRGHIHVLDNDSMVIDGVRFLGSTLWTDFNYDGDVKAQLARLDATRIISDFATIRNGVRKFSPADSIALHGEARSWLVEKLSSKFDGPTVVVTHHLPAARSVAARFANDPLNAAFASRLEHIIEQYQPTLWVHGHTHAASDYRLYGTRVICNPRGYPGENRDDTFRDNLVVSVG